jgi:hypothetical protein
MFGIRRCEFITLRSALPVNPGDQMFAVSMLDFQSAAGTLFLQNSTTNEAITVSVPVGAFAPGFVIAHPDGCGAGLWASGAGASGKPLSVERIASSAPMPLRLAVSITERISA